MVVLGINGHSHCWVPQFPGAGYKEVHLHVTSSLLSLQFQLSYGRHVWPQSSLCLTVYLPLANCSRHIVPLAHCLYCSLKRVWARVPIKFVELFHQLEDLMTPLGNFKYYRQLLNESRDKKPIIPYLVVFLRYVPL